MRKRTNLFLILVLVVSASVANANDTIHWFDSPVLTGQEYPLQSGGNNAVVGFNHQAYNWPTNDYDLTGIALYGLVGSGKLQFILYYGTSLYRDLGEYTVNSSGSYYYELTTPVPILVSVDDLRLIIVKLNGTISLRCDQNGLKTGSAYYTFNGLTWTPIYPVGDWAVGLALTDQTGIIPTSLGRVKALFR